MISNRAEALIDGLQRFARWHDLSKLGNLDPRGFELAAHQFVPDQARTAYSGNDSGH